MSAQGKAFLLKIADEGIETVYQTVAGLRAMSLSLGRDRASVCGIGIFIGVSAEAQIKSRALAGTTANYELSFEDGSKLRARFLVTAVTYVGGFNGERNYLIHLESVGEVVEA